METICSRIFEEGPPECFLCGGELDEGDVCDECFGVIVSADVDELMALHDEYREAIIQRDVEAVRLILPRVEEFTAAINNHAARVSCDLGLREEEG